MPTILIENGFRLYFFANENSEPAHVHVEFQKGMKPSDLRRAGDLVRKHEKLIQEKWNEFFSKKT